MKNFKCSKLFILTILLAFTYITCLSKLQAQIIKIPIIRYEKQPEFPTYDPTRIAEVLRSASNLIVPKFGKDDNVRIVKARSYCLYKNRTKSGFRVHPGVIATGPKYKLGTKVKLWYHGQDLGTYTILDGGDNIINNPNRDGTDNIDIWLADRTCRASRVFGIRKIYMQILHVPKEEVRIVTKVKSRIKKDDVVSNN